MTDSQLSRTAIQIIQIHNGITKRTVRTRSGINIAELNAYCTYDRRWTTLGRAKSIDAKPTDSLIPFHDFPWPAHEGLTPKTFGQYVNAQSVAGFLYTPAHLSTRGCDSDAMEQSEKCNWDTVEDKYNPKLLRYVYKRDRDAVHTAHLIVSLYVHGAEDDNRAVKEAKGHLNLIAEIMEIEETPSQGCFDEFAVSLQPSPLVPKQIRWNHDHQSQIDVEGLFENSQIPLQPFGSQESNNSDSNYSFYNLGHTSDQDEKVAMEILG